VKLATAAWSLMGGRLDWAALPVIVELLGIVDVDILIIQLVALRDRPRE